MLVLNYIEEGVNIHALPTVHEVLNGKPGDEILIGDLHANPMKLFYFLIRHGVLSGLSADEYQDLVTICTKKAEDLSESDLMYFKLLLNGLTYNPDVIVNLGGDNVSDRHKGPAEVFIMLLIKSLIEHNVMVKNYVSNHDVEFIDVCEEGLIHDELQAPRLTARDSRSMRETGILLKNGLITKEELLMLYNNYYKTTYRAVGYFIDSSDVNYPHIYIVSHAGIDKNTIKKEADYLDPDAGGHDVTFFARLMRTMDVIEKKFRLVINGNWVHDLYDTKEIMEAYKRSCNLSHAPFVCSMWNRDYDSLDREKHQMDYDVSYIHCHDSLDPGAPNCCNLDNELGKTEKDATGRYSMIYVTNHEVPLEFVAKYQFYKGTVVSALRDEQLAFRENQLLFEDVELDNSSGDEDDPSSSLRKSIVTILQRDRLFSCIQRDSSDEVDSKELLGSPTSF